jgi:hypothetical protein
MKVNECRNFNPDYPELFTWGHVDSPTLSSLGNIIRAAIEADLRTADRNLTPGLRQALRYLADLADV